LFLQDKKRSQTSSSKHKALHDDASDKDRKNRERSRRRDRSYSDSDHERRSSGRKRRHRDRSRHRSRRHSSRRSSSSRSSNDRRRSRRRVYEDGELSESSGESDASSGSVEVVRSADEKYEGEWRLWGGHQGDTTNEYRTLQKLTMNSMNDSVFECLPFLVFQILPKSIRHRCD
jgi:hypothetical protein